MEVRVYHRRSGRQIADEGYIIITEKWRGEDLYTLRRDHKAKTSVVGHPAKIPLRGENARGGTAAKAEFAM